MPSTRQECLAHAKRCRELAANVTDFNLKGTFLQLAGDWTRLARTMDDMGLHDEAHEMRPRKAS
jgi:hypothetical protein